MQASRKFNWNKFATDVCSLVGQRSLRAAARDLGINHATFWRATQGMPVNVADVVYLLAIMPGMRLTDYVKVTK